MSLFAGVPLPDVIIFGHLGTSEVEQVTAQWPGGRAKARRFGERSYRIDIPVDSKNARLGAKRPFAALEGDVVEILLDGIPAGTVVVGAPGRVAEVDIQSGKVPDGPDLFRRGDTNGDSDIDISDATSSLSYLFGGATPPSCFDAADANDDGEVDLSDPVMTLAYAFLGGPEPPSPGTAHCGSDPTPDNLPRCVQPGCGKAPPQGGIAGMGEKRRGRGDSGERASPAEPHVAVAQPIRDSAAAGRSRRESLDPMELAVLARVLEISPTRVDFGAVQMGHHDVQSIVVHNPTPIEIPLEKVFAKGDGFAALVERCVVPAGGHAVIPVVFLPSEKGRRESQLVLAPGVAVPLIGHARKTAPRVHMGSAQLADVGGEAGANASISVRIEDLPAGSEVELSWSFPHDVTDVAALYRLGDKAKPIDFEVERGVVTARAQLGRGATGLEAIFELTRSGDPAERVSVLPLRVESLVVDGQSSLERGQPSFGHGELVVGDAALSIGAESVPFSEVLDVLRSVDLTLDRSSWDSNEDGRVEARELVDRVRELLAKGVGSDA
ncbi:MAG: hypothetical protein AAF517_07725 [Planctomycetota bacterium]